MAEPYNFENCGTNDPPEILDVTFNVNGIAGTPDFSGAGDQTNPPIIGSNVQVIATWTNEDSEEIVNYQFFLDGSGTVVPSVDSIASITDESLAGETLLCTVTVSNSIGSVDFTINMGVVYGLPPELPSTINSLLTIIPPINSVVAPGDSVSVTYTPQINQLGAPNINSITTIVNGQSFTGTSFTYTVSADESGNGCEIKIEQVDVSNVTEGVPNTGTDSKSYNLKIATVQSPIAGQPCGEALGRCCWTGGFDSVTGITTGNCDILTSGACDAVNGVWAEGVLECPTCDGSVGTPCCDEIGTGRCCCVQTDNTGLCIDGLTFGECNSSNSLFANCGGSEEFPDIVWSHNQNCSSSTEPPCQGPPTGRCCEVFADGSGTTCAIGLEQLDCPRYPDSTDFAWTSDGNCPDCTVPSQNFGEPCCEPLGRCCLLGDIDSDGFNESLQTPNITERACDQLASDNGYTSINWTQNTPGQSSTNINCNNFGTANANPLCCLPRGRCCWKESDGSGNFQLNVTEEECSVLAGSNPRQWSFAINTSPNCSGNQLSTNLCCDTSRGRCCENNGTQNICTPDVIFDNCNGSGQDFANGQPCPTCDAGVGAPCCNGDVTITNVRFNPSTVVAGSAVTLFADISNDNISKRRWTYSRTGNAQSNTGQSATAYTVPFASVGDILTGKVETEDYDGTAFSEEIEVTINGQPPVLPTSLNISVSPGVNWPGNLDPGDTVTISNIQTSAGNPDSTIEWQFESLNGNVLSSGSGLEPITINYIVSDSDDALEECGLKLRLTAFNNSTGIPGTGSVNAVYPSWTVSGDPGDLCGVPIGRCCVTGDFDPATGITSAGCTNGFSEADCLARNGSWGEGESCPTCDGSVGTPCCPEIGTGRCCCTQTDNTAKCVNGLTFGDCTFSNLVFASCGDSPTATPTWFHNQDCPTVCNDTIGAPCCAPPTGRCCEILPEGNSDGLPPGVTCEIGLEEFDCPRYFSSTLFEWSEDGTCPDCTDPQQNFNNDVCCPEKLGRCCCSTNPSIFEGFCRANVTEADCTSLCGVESPTWTQNSGEFMPGGLQCPDCSDPTENEGLPCCNSLGRCCYKYEADGDEAREGACYRGVTYGDCLALAEQDNALTQPAFTEDNPSCPDCGDGNNTDPCCDDTEIVRGICCTSGECDDNEGAGVISTECSGSFDPSTTTCPNCLDSGENTGQPCCVAGYPVLSIDEVLVDNLPISDDNPILPGSTIRIVTTEENLVNVNYRFIVEIGSYFTLSQDSKEYTVPETLDSAGLPGNLGGRDILFGVTAESPLVGVPAEELQISEYTVGTINGFPPTEITPTIIKVGSGQITSPITQGDIILISSVTTDSVPVSAIEYQWLDADENDISGETGGFYIVTNGVIENCRLKVRITADNTVNASFTVPGGGVLSQVFDIQQIIVPEGSGSPCIASGNEGTCCCGSSIDSSTGISGGTCENFVTETVCNQKVTDGECAEVLWTDRDYINVTDDFCPTCDTKNGADGGADYPCCSQYPTGRCCVDQTCSDNKFKSECDELGGEWDIGESCPCPVPIDFEINNIEYLPLSTNDSVSITQEINDPPWINWNPESGKMCKNYKANITNSGDPSTVFTYNWRLEKIPSSFCSSLDGITSGYEFIPDMTDDSVVRLEIHQINETYSVDCLPNFAVIPMEYKIFVDVTGTTGSDSITKTQEIPSNRILKINSASNITDFSKITSLNIPTSYPDVTQPENNRLLYNFISNIQRISNPNQVRVTVHNIDEFLQRTSGCGIKVTRIGSPNVQLFSAAISSGSVSGNVITFSQSSNNTSSWTNGSQVKLELTSSLCESIPYDGGCPVPPIKPIKSWVPNDGSGCQLTDGGDDGIGCVSIEDTLGISLTSLTDCDFREIVVGAGDIADPVNILSNGRCNYNGLCSCLYPSDGPYCGGRQHENSSSGRNLIYLVEQAVCQFDSFCCDNEWDGVCADYVEDWVLLTVTTEAERDDIKSVIEKSPSLMLRAPTLPGDPVYNNQFNPYRCLDNQDIPCIDTIFDDDGNDLINTSLYGQWDTNCYSGTGQVQGCRYKIFKGINIPCGNVCNDCVP